MRSSSSSRRNWRQVCPKSEPKTCPFRDHLRGRAEMRDPIGCSLGFVTLPISVSALSRMRADLSKSGALMRRGSTFAWAVKPFPFSSAVNLRDAIASRWICVICVSLF